MTIALVEGHTSPIRLTLVSSVTTACGPGCGTPSARICSTYRRKLQEIPYGSAAVELQLIVHRFRCDVPACTQHIFCERVPWAPPYQRRTQACTDRILTLAWAMSASATQRVAATEGMQASRTTINRWLVRWAETLPLTRRVAAADTGVLTGVGIDDWAWAKGRRYGTVVVDLTTHQPVDVLPDRRAVTVADWLRHHPTIRVIARDRAGSYAKGAREGAPQAQQVADRFHLVKNWGERIAVLVQPWDPPRPAAAPDPMNRSTPDAPPSSPLAEGTRTADPQARWEAVHALHREGLSLWANADRFHCTCQTVQQDLAADQPRASTIPGSR